MLEDPTNTIECPFCSAEIYHESERCPHCENYIFYEGADELDDSDELIDCPACGEEIFDESEQCPHCGQYITEEETPENAQKPAWLLLGALLCLLIVLGWILSGM